MNIVIDFARLLLEADQLALDGHHEKALKVYAAMAKLQGLGPAEAALISTRLEMLRSAMHQADDSVEVVTRSQEQPAPSAEAEAEALVNQGDLPAAIEIYDKLVRDDPSHDLARERLAELRATATADTGSAAAATPVSAGSPAPMRVSGDWRTELPADPVALLEELLARVHSNRRVA